MKKITTMNIKVNWYFILFSPIFFNFIYNLIKNISAFQKFNFYNLISTILGFTSIVLIGYLIKVSFKLNNISLGIVIYLLSFFITDIFTLFITTNISFKHSFLITNMFWFVLFLVRRVNFRVLFLFCLNFIILRIFNHNFINKFEINSNIEVDSWYYLEFCKQIINNNYFYSMNNNLFAGYTQFSSYLHSVMFEYFFSLNSYVYLKPTTNVLFFLTCYFLFELKIDKNQKLFIIFLYSSLVLNSDWLSFLLFDSIMSEGILNYIFAILLFNLFDEKRPEHLKYIYLFFGLLIFSKQFYISLVLINLVFLFIFKDSRKFVKYGFIAFLLKQIMYLSYFSNLEKDHHIRQIDIIDTILDLLLFRDLNPNNIFGILNNLFIDKPLTYLLLIIFVLIFYLILNREFMNKILYFLIGNIISNFLLIFLLYISVWRNMELESPIRFILNLFLIFLLFISNSVQTINSKTN